MPLTDAQKFRAARGILGWSQRDLADYAGISAGAIHSLENDKRKMHPNNKYACWRAFTDAGITFTDMTITYMPVKIKPVLPTPTQKIGAPTQ